MPTPACTDLTQASASAKMPSLDVFEAKIRVPALRPGSIYRPRLVNRLRVVKSQPIVLLVAGAGYGKTTLLAQWAERDERPFAWVSIDERDNEPVVLLRHVAASLDRIEPLEPELLDSLREGDCPLWPTAVPRLAAALSSLEAPFVLVLDNISQLRSREALDVAAALIEHVPVESTVALAGRTAPQLSLAALRAGGRLYEVGDDFLALSRREANLLFRETGVELTDDRMDELLLRTEGWAAGLYLAALAFRDTRSEAETVEFGGDDRYLADYFRSEYLADLTPERLAFLRAAAVFDRMCGGLCDAVLERTGSALELEAIAETNQFLVPLDRRGEWYRLHGLFRDFLRRELRHHEPRRPAVLNGRAASWFETHGELEAAVEYAAAAGDLDRLARLLGSLVLPACQEGRVADAERWLAPFADESQLDRYPSVALLGTWVHALADRSSEAERWLAAAARAATDGAHPWLALLRAALCRDGVDQMLKDAEAAAAGIPVDDGWHPIAAFLRGTAYGLLGQEQRADEALADAAEEAEIASATASCIAAVVERALVAAGRGDHEAAATLALEARELAAAGDADGRATSLLELALSARALLLRGRWDEARDKLEAARCRSARPTQALPWLAVQARLELARAHVTLRDIEAARTVLAEVRRILRRHSDLGVLVEQAKELEREVEAILAARACAESGLTAAELRLLPLLATHLSFREIGARLYVSRNTIKTQAISVYRKLGVSSRSEAIEEAARLGLVEAAVAA